ncbi:hypothetical protein CHARACLAT_007871 [Characodon lateralis]|uniref:Uncharacterized protein n=1 Tax=Characodon lateralis TaxID=208331 RepID=A0ABU7E0A0_9TELE|nr:hypothetical protein [Characodon lateralis]
MVSQPVSIGYKIIGKTAGLTDVQKTVIDNLLKEVKPEKVIPTELVVQSPVSKHIHRKLSRSKILLRIWGSFIMSGLRLESVHQEPPHRRILQTGYKCCSPRVKPLLNLRRQKFLMG